MLSHKIVLRQISSLSFFATSLVIVLTTQPSLAFSVNPLLPVSGTQNWHTDENDTLTNQSTDTMTPNTSADQSVIRGGGTTSFCRPSWGWCY